ncbi:hypothetical protein HMPREF9689_01759 [Klebsiella oxytoca 10-5245]|nr:hypothetical protein HMPREF9689_01759 [Klebsiella oxytoca 10-5245]
MYFWNDVHSTWLEASYQRVDYDRGGDNRGWKLTLSQNIAIGMGAESRPMLRFYVPGGRVDNKHIAKVNDSSVERLHSLNVGGMFEAWFQVCRHLREQAGLRRPDRGFCRPNSPSGAGPDPADRDQSSSASAGNDPGIPPDSA